MQFSKRQKIDIFKFFVLLKLYLHYEKVLKIKGNID